ncbi:class III lanthionine synthetase LanKC [Streptomyces sp. NPDC102274]|uniref:class III lanthionine synthetase LanKC n=1 Tax=Streptomyces sp. NPDC102274 TaxID=3366151 RepID=UPI0037FA5BF5
MDVRYPAYCLADARFYDSPDRAQPGDEGVDYRDVIAAAAGWQQVPAGQWTQFQPPPGRPELPAQGWKIHVSVTLDNAVEILTCVSAYCFRKNIPFKFLTNSHVFMARNGKYAPRESSGKFLTLYPRDLPGLKQTLHDLDRETGGSAGPYILSDLQWNQGPLYVRYGGFTWRYTYGGDGTLVAAVERPDGVLVADLREPRFTVPDWVEVPDFLAEAVAPRLAGEQPEEFPYEVLGVLHFSNGGGVYRARRFRDGLELVLKEGRPHAGLDRMGRDAPTRLRTEHTVLSALRGIPGIPLVHDYHVLGGHDFLAMEYVRGQSLQTWITVNYLNLRVVNDGSGTKEYLESVAHILDQLERTLRAVHDQGYVFNDLHPGNILIDDDLNLTLIDFEAVQPKDHPGPRALGAPGFTPPDSLRGIDGDLYSLSAVRLFLYLPLNSLLALCPAKATTLIDAAQSRLGLDDDVIAPLTRALTTSQTAPSGLRPAEPALAFTSVTGPWELHTTALTASIRGSASPGRQDRIFPGDINQFFHGGGGVAFGAAGVIDTLHQAGAGDLEPYVEWLEQETRTSRRPRFGLYDGMAGISHVLYNLGRTEAACALYDRSADGSEGLSGTKLFDGLSGIGLVGLSFYRRTGKTRYREHAVRAAVEVERAIESGVFAASAVPVGSVRRERRGNSIDNFSGGLLYGWSGLALFMVRMFEATGEDRWLGAALTAVHRDLDQCETLSDGTMQVKNQARVLPYLATGSAGVALVCDLVLNHVDDDRLRRAVTPLSLACADDLCVCGGLFNGRAGLVGALRQVAHRLDWPDVDERIDAGVRGLNLYALSDEYGLIFPGEQNLRASTDLATGSAGVLRLLNVLAGRTSEILPFLGPEPWAVGSR